MLQQTISPGIVLEDLKRGNKAFTEGRTIKRNDPERMKSLLEGQHPKAIVLSCIDSRVPVEDIFHQNTGDLFVARIAGNFVDKNIAGSMEYACKYCGSKLILVLGHEDCGAIKSAVDGIIAGNISAMLENLGPALKKATSDFGDKRTSSDKAFIESVCRYNVLYNIGKLRTISPILSEMENKKEILIAGGIYHLVNGKVDFM